MTERTADQAPLPGGHFKLLVQKFGYQALINMGVIDHPLSGKAEINLDHARAVLEDLTMLREKTAGNLDEDEEGHLVQVIDDLEAHLQRLGAE